MQAVLERNIPFGDHTCVEEALSEDLDEVGLCGSAGKQIQIQGGGLEPCLVTDLHT